MNTTSSTEKKLYRPSDVMDIFDISRPTFNDWCKKGVFQKISIPGQRRVYVTAQSVDKLIRK
jgi:predicted site-specific integrase-resolvase